MLLAARTSRSCVRPHSQVQTRSLSLSDRLILPQVQSLLDGSNRPILMTVLPYQDALYSSCRTNSDQLASEIARASRRFFTNPATFRSSIATAWFSRITLEDSLCRKSLRWFRIFSCASATRIRCLLRFLLPFFLRSIRRCSCANLFCDALRNRGLPNFSPLLNVAKWDRPKSIPSTSLYGNASGTSFPVSTSTEAKCLPDGSRDTVTVFTLPSNRREQANRIGLNFGNWIVSQSKSILTYCGHWYDCRPPRFLNLGKPWPCLKNPWYAFSRLMTDCCKLAAFTSFSHSVSSWSLRFGNLADNFIQLILSFFSCHSFTRNAKASLYTHRQAPKCLDSSIFCFSFG